MNRVKAFARRKNTARDIWVNWWEDGTVTQDEFVLRDDGMEAIIQLPNPPQNTEWNEQDFHKLHINDWGKNEQANQEALRLSGGYPVEVVQGMWQWKRIKS